MSEKLSNARSTLKELSTGVPYYETDYINNFYSRDLSEDIELLFSLKEKEFNNFITEKEQTYPWLSEFYADYLYAYDMHIAQYLNTKSRPAHRAAQDVRRIAKEKRELITQNKMLEHQLTVYEDLFPWLLDFKELSIEDAAKYAGLVSDTNNEYSILKNWLSPEEYQNLSTKEKYQLALDRYIHKPKSKWQVGIDYERYIGYLYEQKGYRVKYNGALSGLEDMGRDLIATSGKYIIVIQCKRWAQEKTIHEKHIFQLFGSMVLAEIENPGKIVRGLFVTTTKLSDTAIQCAKHLGIEIVQNKPMADYPMIKCNIAKDGEKIYHLPFDQQYDRIMLNSKDGDFYCKTIAEAEDKGFRRAWKWHGTN
ncbi:MAG: restriction endonuclease [Oscillospiraceae bacterium]|nr:restriction endonuclease [Oscillospiraceae bacterium]